MAILARLGMWCLKKAVLNGMPTDKSKIRTAELSRKIGLYREHENHAGNDWITQGVLSNLAGMKNSKIIKDNSGNKRQHGWRLK